MPVGVYRDEYVRVRGLRLHYLDYGGEGEVLVALHGLVQNAHAFDSIAPLLFPDVHLLALDFRGRGLSEWAPPDSYRMLEYLKDLRAFVNALGFEKVGLIGTSLGGWVAMLYATAYPTRVSRLILNDCAVTAEAAGLHRVASRPSVERFEFRDLEEAIAWFVADRPGLERLEKDDLRSWVGQFVIPSEAGGVRFHCDPSIVGAAGALASRLNAMPGGLMGPEHAWEQAKRLTMPVLLLRGTLSDVVSPKIASRFVRVLPDARCVEVPGASHSPTLYEPEAQAALLEFFGLGSRAAVACEAN